MGWKFWKREPSEAERSLADLQAQAEQQRERLDAATLPGSGSQVAPDPADQLPIEREATEHMLAVSNQLTGLLSYAPGEEEGTFMLEVTRVEAVPAQSGAVGSVRLHGGAHEGSAEPGVVVGVMTLPRPPSGELVGREEQARALLGFSAQSGTVVAWQADPPILELSGLTPDQVVVGSMVIR